MKLSPLRALFLLNVLLAAGLLWMWVDEKAQPRGIVWVAPLALAPGLATPASLMQSTLPGGNTAQYPAILERPIFAADRKPPPVAALASVTDPLADVQITGLFSGANGGALARVAGGARRIMVGQSIGDWVLKSVEGRTATFAKGEETRQLQLAYSQFGIPVPQIASNRPPPVAAADPGNLQSKFMDEARERLRRTNEVRAKHGIPLLNE